MDRKKIEDMLASVKRELFINIIPFWLEHSLDRKNGGFIGQLSNDLIPDYEAPKGLVLNSRLLWTFSALTQFSGNQSCMRFAHQACEILMSSFWDSKYGGGFWLLSPNHSVEDNQKKIYGQAFLLYALSEYYKIVPEESVIARVRELFELIERHAYDSPNQGYYEVCQRDWTFSNVQQLSSKDLDAAKSMNNHLHLLEAFTNLYRVWKNPLAAVRLRMLISLFCEKIIDAETGHLVLFFDETWKRKSNIISYGHDIEASWLLCEAAEVLGDTSLLEKIQKLSIRMAQVTYEEAIDSRGGLCYEKNQAGRLNRSKDFWCQAEAAIGFLNAYQLTQKQYFLKAAVQMWEFIQNVQVDKEHGEWFLQIDPDNRPVSGLPKISEWKDPYHNGRCCIELIRRLSSLFQVEVQDNERQTVVYE